MRAIASIRSRNIRRPRQAAGFSIGIVLIAVTLMLALGTAILMSSRTSQGYDTYSYEDTYAAQILAQARNLKAGIATMTSNGTSLSSITFDTGANGLFNPATGGVEPQTPSPNVTNQPWVWKVDGSGNPVVKLYNIGNSANADYVIALPGVFQQFCAGINWLLHSQRGSTTVTAGTLADWETPATAIDLSASGSGTQGWSDGCIKTTDNYYVFFETVRPE